MGKTLKQRIGNDVKVAMRAREKKRLGTLRMLMAAIKQREIDERITLDDDDVIQVIAKMLKQRRDSLQQFSSAGRDDLVAQEAFEIDLLGTYLPAPLDSSELDRLVAEAITECGASSMAHMGNVIRVLKPRVQGRADMAAVSNKVKQRLS